MLAAGLIVGAIALSGPGLVPGDPPPETPATVVSGAPDADAAAPDPADPTAALLGLGALLAALAARGAGSALGLRPPDDALVVVVPGHGQGAPDAAFARLVDLMGVDPADVRGFDHRWVTGQHDPHAASQTSPIGPTAASLNAYLAGVGAEGRPIWLIGFSKGGATIAEMLAGWDHGYHRPPADVRGAFLLDPPMARGAHGALQSAGRVAGWIPDDGGYDPVECAFLRFGCHDHREHLGRAAGVEVLVVRNPRAGITSFSDRPEGLRVVDAPDDGPGLLDQLLKNPFALPGRIAAAHESVLSVPAVARCLVAEMHDPGSCALDVPRLPSLRPLARLLPSAKVL